jgi:hypothetical protein
MKRHFNKQSLSENFLPQSNLGDIISGLEQKFQLNGEVICRVAVNGNSLSEEQEKSQSGMAMAEIDSIEVETSTPRDVLLEVLKQWIDNVPLLIDECDRVSGNLRFQNIETVYPGFSQLVRNCQVFVNSLESVFSFVRTDLGKSSDRWKLNEREMQRTTKEVLSAFENRDIARLADTIEYDLAHCLQVWRELLVEIQQDKMGPVEAPIGRT